MSSTLIKTLFEELRSERELDDRAEPLFNDGRAVYIYGAGGAGKDLARLLRKQGIALAGFLDREPRGGTWEGIPILKPEAIPAADRARVHAVIGVFNGRTEMPPIARLLHDLGYGRVTTFLEFHAHYAAELGDRYWLTDTRFYLDQEEAATEGAQIWDDQVSRDVYASVLHFRFTRKYELLPPPGLHDQYFPEGLPAWPKPVRFVDCGAFNGDTVRALLQRHPDVEAFAAFEPDPGNFRELETFVQAQSLAGIASLYPCVVGARTHQIRFSAGAGEASCKSEQGETEVQCVALDETLSAFRPTVIKMDVEGSEPDALVGARGLIERHRPGLAISVYHRPEHLWTIPLLLRSWLKGGRHYLRTHAYNSFEVIYYWLP
jgi:FkbM family methyltransferase